MIKPSDKLIKFLAVEEGFRDTAYKPFEWDRWTVGHGFTFIRGVPVVEGQTITEKESLKVLEYEVELLYRRLKVLNAVHENTTEQQLDAVLSLIYNVGIKAFTSSETGELFSRGKDIGFKFPLWCKGNGIPIKGLWERRLRELEIYEVGEYRLDHSVNTKYSRKYPFKGVNRV